MNWERVVARIAARVEDRIDRTRHRLARRRGIERPVRVVPYRSYGNGTRLRVRGRVLYGEAPPASAPEDRWWRNVANAYRMLESDEVPHARARVRFGGVEVEATADEEGHIHADLELPAPPDPGRLWHEARIEVVEPRGDTGSAMVAVPHRPRFGVISDLDDTVLKTNATSLLRMAREVLFRNVHTRIPFPGVGAFYRALHTGAGGEVNPLFYVSSSPWNLYGVLSEFLHLHEIPAGPMELRDWGLSAREVLPTGHRAHKRVAIDRILETYPELPFILVGDSGQEDPEIYGDVVRAHPGRVLGIYIRSVRRTPERVRAIDELAATLAQDRHPDLVLVDDTLEAARHAVERGWIAPADLEAVARSRDAER